MARTSRTKCPHERIEHCPLYVGMHIAGGPTKCRWCGGNAPGLIEKSVYTVNWITISHGDVMVGVAEASGCIGTVGLYHHTNFRPCKPTSIEGLKTILSKPKKLEPV